MSTVSQLIDRVLREYIWPPDQQPLYTKLTAGITDADGQTVQYDAGYFDPDEEDKITEGLVVGINSELMVVDTPTIGSDQFTVTSRGYRSTTAAAHSTGDLVYLAPNPARVDVFNAVADAVQNLWPDLWQVKSTQISVPATGARQAPADVEEIVGFLFFDGYQWRQGSVELLRDFPLVGTERAVQAMGDGAGRSGWLTYKTGFTRPTAESDDLGADFGVQAQWEKIIVVDAAQSIINSMDIDTAQLEFLTDRLQLEGFPVRSGEFLALALLRQREYLLSIAKRQLRFGQPKRMSVGGRQV